jgi:hypothetical protein
VATVVEWAPDATQNIQDALDSAADTVIVPNVGRDWIVGPDADPTRAISIPSNKTLKFEDGVILRAKAGAYTDDKARMFAIQGKSNVTVTMVSGTAQIHMWASAYAGGSPSQHRHIFRCSDTDTLAMDGLRLYGAGGDAILIGGSGAPPCIGVTLDNIRTAASLRNGLSITSVDGITVKGTCEFDGSIGPPGAGIGIEPNEITDVIKGVVIEAGVTCRRNKHAPIYANVSRLNATSDDVDVSVTGLTGIDCGLPFWAESSDEDPVGEDPKGNGSHVGGSIVFTDCVQENCGPEMDFNDLYGITIHSFANLTSRNRAVIKPVNPQRLIRVQAAPHITDELAILMLLDEGSGTAVKNYGFGSDFTADLTHASWASDTKGTGLDVDGFAGLPGCILTPDDYDDGFWSLAKSEYTFLFAVSVPADASAPIPILLDYGNNTVGHGLGYNTATNDVLSYMDNSGSSIAKADKGLELQPSGSDHVRWIAVTFKDGKHSIHVDGITIAAHWNVTHGQSSMPGVSAQSGFLAGHTETSFSANEAAWRGMCYAILGFKRALTDDQIARIVHDGLRALYRLSPHTPMEVLA